MEVWYLQLYHSIILGSVPCQGPRLTPKNLTDTGLFRVYPDEFDLNWTTRIDEFYYMIILSAGHWYYHLLSSTRRGRSPAAIGVTSLSVLCSSATEEPSGPPFGPLTARKATRHHLSMHIRSAPPRKQAVGQRR